MSNTTLSGEIGDENFLEGLKDNDQWRSAFLRIICDVWEGKIQTETTGNKPEQKSIFEWSPQEVRHMMAKLVGYEVPANMDLTFSEFKGDAQYDPNARVDGKKANGWNKVMNEKKDGDLAYVAKVEMMIPPRPDSDQAMAITDYMAAGKAYPFTIV